MQVDIFELHEEAKSVVYKTVPGNAKFGDRIVAWNKLSGSSGQPPPTSNTSFSWSGVKFQKRNSLQVHSMIKLCKAEELRLSDSIAYCSLWLRRLLEDHGLQVFKMIRGENSTIDHRRYDSRGLYM